MIKLKNVVRPERPPIAKSQWKDVPIGWFWRVRNDQTNGCQARLFQKDKQSRVQETRCKEWAFQPCDHFDGGLILERWGYTSNRPFDKF